MVVGGWGENMAGRGRVQKNYVMAGRGWWRQNYVWYWVVVAGGSKIMIGRGWSWMVG